MNKWFGKIGFVMTVQDENKPSKWVEKVVEKDFYGDVLNNYHKWEQGLSVTDDANISNQISVVANDFAINNLQYKQMPRLILGIGGVWNGKRADS